MHRKIHREVFRAIYEQPTDDLAPHHLMIMRMLHEMGPCHLTGIGDEIAISRSQMTHSTDKLISLGLIERHPDGRDRRKIIVQLTAKGEETLGKLQQITRDRLQAKLACLTDADLDRLAASLRNMAEIITKLQ
jgi:DNA-binding MarR family transcriptional regulator